MTPPVRLSTPRGVNTLMITLEWMLFKSPSICKKAIRVNSLHCREYSIRKTNHCNISFEEFRMEKLGLTRENDRVDNSMS